MRTTTRRTLLIATCLPAAVLGFGLLFSIEVERTPQSPTAPSVPAYLQARSAAERCASARLVGDRRNALAWASHATSLEPENCGYRLLFGFALLDSGDENGATLQLERALLGPNSRPSAEEALLEIRGREADRRAEARAWEVRLLSGAAESAHALGHRETARVLYQALYERDPDHGGIPLGYFLLEIGLYAEAYAVFARQLERADSSAEAREGTLWAAHGLAHVDEALAHLDALEARWGSTERTRSIRGDLLLSMPSTPAIESPIASAPAPEPIPEPEPPPRAAETFQDAGESVANAYQRLQCGDPRGALELLERIPSEDPHADDAREARIWALLALNEAESALKLAIEHKDLLPENTRRLEILADVSSAIPERRAEAESIYRALRAAQPFWDPPSKKLSALLAARGEVVLAYETLQSIRAEGLQAEEIDRECETLLAQLPEERRGRLRAELLTKRPARVWEAIAAWREVLRDDPSAARDAHVYRTCAELLLRAGDAKGALEIAKRAFTRNVDSDALRIVGVEAAVAAWEPKTAIRLLERITRECDDPHALLLLATLRLSTESRPDSESIRGLLVRSMAAKATPEAAALAAGLLREGGHPIRALRELERRPDGDRIYPLWTFERIVTRASLDRPVLVLRELNGFVPLRLFTNEPSPLERTAVKLLHRRIAKASGLRADAKLAIAPRAAIRTGYFSDSSDFERTSLGAGFSTTLTGETFADTKIYLGLEHAKIADASKLKNRISLGAQGSLPAGDLFRLGGAYVFRAPENVAPTHEGEITLRGKPIDELELEASFRRRSIVDGAFSETESALSFRGIGSGGATVAAIDERIRIDSAALKVTFAPIRAFWAFAEPTLGRTTDDNDTRSIVAGAFLDVAAWLAPSGSAHSFGPKAVTYALSFRDPSPLYFSPGSFSAHKALLAYRYRASLPIEVFLEAGAATLSESFELGVAAQCRATTEVFDRLSIDAGAGMQDDGDYRAHSLFMEFTWRF